MKNTKLISVAAILLLVTACGQTSHDVAFKGEETASTLSSNSADRTKDQGAYEEGSVCESEEDLRQRNAEEFVCIYPEFNYKGQACCIQRVNGARFVQVPDENPRSRTAGSLVHHGFRASLGLSANPRVTSNSDLDCLNQFGPQPGYKDPACAKFNAAGANMTFGIFGATDRLSSWSESGGPVQLFGVKTLIFE